MTRKMIYVTGLVTVTLIGTFAVAMAARAGYESAEYTVIESDGAIEIREYPDLMLASTDSTMNSQGRDGSFMRLFRYISGANDAELAREQEARLRQWMAGRELEGEDAAEAAGYDPPFTPAALRRNEILIRLKESPTEKPSGS